MGLSWPFEELHSALLVAGTYAHPPFHARCHQADTHIELTPRSERWLGAARGPLSTHFHE